MRQKRLQGRHIIKMHGFLKKYFAFLAVDSIDF
jgi:hypothetical protein